MRKRVFVILPKISFVSFYKVGKTLVKLIKLIKGAIKAQSKSSCDTSHWQKILQN